MDESRDSGIRVLKARSRDKPPANPTKIYWDYGKTADPDIPILKEANAEYAKLQ